MNSRIVNNQILLEANNSKKLNYYRTHPNQGTSIHLIELLESKINSTGKGKHDHHVSSSCKDRSCFEMGSLQGSNYRSMAQKTMGPQCFK